MLSDKEWAAMTQAEQGEYDACVRIVDGDVQGSEYLKDSDRISAKRDIQKLEAIASLRAQLAERDATLLRHGFRRCDIAACNCGSWHHTGGLAERWREIEDDLAEAGHPLTNENGHLLRKALAALVGERDTLRAQLATAQAELARVTAERDGAREALALFAKWRTADGVYVQPGDWVYVCEKDFRFKVSHEGTIPCAVHEFGIGWRDMLVHECYSTAEAAFPHPTPEGKP